MNSNCSDNRHEVFGRDHKGHSGTKEKEIVMEQEKTEK